MAPARYHEPGMYISYTNTGQNTNHFLPGSLLLYSETSTSCARDRPLGLVWFGLVWFGLAVSNKPDLWVCLVSSICITGLAETWGPMDPENSHCITGCRR